MERLPCAVTCRNSSALITLGKAWLSCSPCYKAGIMHLSVRTQYFPNAELWGPAWFVLPVKKKNISGVSWWLLLFPGPSEVPFIMFSCHNTFWSTPTAAGWATLHPAHLLAKLLGFGPCSFSWQSWVRGMKWVPVLSVFFHRRKSAPCLDIHTLQLTVHFLLTPSDIGALISKKWEWLAE